MASIQERKNKNGTATYRAVIRLKGFPAQIATFKRKTDAKRWAQQTESAILEGRHFKTAESKKHTLSELIDRYIRDVIPNKKKNGGNQKTQLLWWKNYLGDYLLSDITSTLIADGRDKLLQEITYRGKKMSNSTVVRYLAALSHELTVASFEWGWIESYPMKKVKKPTEPRGRVRFLDNEERDRLLGACKSSNHP